MPFQQSGRAAHSGGGTAGWTDQIGGTNTARDIPCQKWVPSTRVDRRAVVDDRLFAGLRTDVVDSLVRSGAVEGNSDATKAAASVGG